MIVKKNEVSLMRGDEEVVIQCDDIDFTAIPYEVLYVALIPSIVYDTNLVSKKVKTDYNIKIQSDQVPREIYSYIKDELEWRKKSKHVKLSFSFSPFEYSWEVYDKYLLPFGGGKETWLQYSMMKELNLDFSAFYVQDPAEEQYRPLHGWKNLECKTYFFKVNRRLARLQYYGIPLILSYLDGYKTTFLGSDAGHHTVGMKYYGVTPLWQMVTNKLMEKLGINFRFSSLVSCLPPGAVVKVLCERYGDTWKNIHSLPSADELPGKWKNERFYHPKFHRVCAFLMSCGKNPEDVGLDKNIYLKMIFEDLDFILKSGKGDYCDDIGHFINDIGEGWGDKIISSKKKYIFDELSEKVISIYKEHLEEYEKDIPELSDSGYAELFNKLTRGF